MMFLGVDDDYKKFSNGSKGIYCFCFLLLYLPFQSYLPSTSIGFGINLLNVLLVLLLMLNSGVVEDFKFDRYEKIKVFILIYMAYSLISTLLNGLNGELYTSIMIWKRTFFIPIIFFITYKIVNSYRRVLISLSVMTFVTFVSSIQVIRNNSEFSGGHYNDGLRYGGMFGAGGENDLAAFLAIFFFLFLFWSQYFSNKVNKVILLLMSIVVGFACLYCYSRGAYIALFIGLLYYAWKSYKFILVIMIVLSFSLPFWAPRPVLERVQMLTQDEKLEADGSAQSRLVIWGGGLKMMSANFPFGVGPDNFNKKIRMYVDLPSNSPTASHNMYLKMVTELGIPGLLFLLLFLVSFLKAGYCLSREAQGWYSTWGTTFVAITIAVVVVNFFGDRFIREGLTGYIWVAGAITYRMLAMHSHGRQHSDSSNLRYGHLVLLI